MRKTVIPYFDLCTGCRICELVCSARKFGVYAPRKAYIRISIESEGLRAQPIICIQCENAFCMLACPHNAIERDEETSALVVVEEKCTGCRLCIQACPIDAPYFDVETKKAGKCDLCEGEPLCVENCPTKALVFK